MAHAAPQQPGCLSPQLARLLLDGHTQIGDVVLDIDDDIAFAATAAQTARRHHALCGAHHLASIGHAAGYIDLILLHWPRPAVNPHWLLLACRSLLRTAGCLVVAVSVEAEQRVAHLSALGGAASTAGLRTLRHVAAVAPDAATPVAAVGTTSDGQDTTEAGPATAVLGARQSAAVDPHTDLLIFEPEAGHRG